MANEVARRLNERNQTSTLIDLQDFTPPQFDNCEAYDHPHSVELHRRIDEADGIFIAAPVYNWGLGSAVKNLIEITGATNETGRRSAWFDKIVTFLLTGGLSHSYMAYGPLAFALMLDFKCIINPYAVYATDADLTADGRWDVRLSERLDRTIDAKLELTAALKQRTYRSDWEL